VDAVVWLSLLLVSVVLTLQGGVGVPTLPAAKFAQKVLSCDPFEWTNTAFHLDATLDPRLNAHRRTGRPKTRWMDDLKHHIEIHAGTGPNNDPNWHKIAHQRKVAKLGRSVCVQSHPLQSQEDR